MAQNQKWFSDQLRDKKLTQAKLAELLQMSPSGLSLLLSGKRRMRVEQAAEIARFVGAPIADVMRHAGANVSDDGTSLEPLSIPVVGWLDETNTATIDWTRRTHMVSLEEGYPPTSTALQWRTAQTRASMFDGWLVITLPPHTPDDALIMDRLCLVSIKGSNKVLLRKVKRGYSPGVYTLLDFVEPAIHDAELAWASPILSIKPV